MKPKPFFKERAGWVEAQSSRTVNRGCRSIGLDPKKAYHVRVTDYRRPSALRAVEKACEAAYLQWAGIGVAKIAEAAGMTATLRDGRVKCDWRDK